MKKILLVSFSLFALSVLLVKCKKSELELNGTASVANFTFQITPLQDTLPYALNVSFTNESEQALQYQWDFGDNSPLSSEKDPIHQYFAGGEYSVRMTSVGTNGNNTITKRIFVTDACQDDFFTNLTGCSNLVWTWSTDADAIKVLSPDATQVFFSGAAASCQVDDKYTFYADGRFTYDANGETFDAQSGFSCQAPKANSENYKVVSRPGQQPQIILNSTLTPGAGTAPFIGTTDIVDDNRYTVMSYSSDQMTLRSVITGSGGQLLEIKMKRVVALTLADIKTLLNGGSSKSWKLDPTPGANAITVGTEGNPTEYFAGGPLDTNCQSDDVYTFTTADKVNYNSNGSTFNGGNVAPNYNCGADRSYNDIAFTFSATTGGVSGLATLQLPSLPPNIFIGTTDVPAENVYRIISINSTSMLLRAGNGTGTVFQFKFIPQ